MKPNPSKPKWNLTDMKEVLIRQRCQEKGISITAHGIGFHIIGPGVDILAANFNSLQIADLQPAKFKFGSGGYVLIR